MKAHIDSRQQLTDSLRQIDEVYTREVMAEVTRNIDLLLPSYEEWLSAILGVGQGFALDCVLADEIPYALERLTLDNISQSTPKQRKSRKLVVGLAGPGASGKETFAHAIGFDHVINTTTRPPRSYEVDGVHYHFVDEQQFYAMREENCFLVTSEKLGRGLYGVQKQDLLRSLESGRAIVEESPLVLAEFARAVYTMDHSYDFILVYLLPPSPILPHLAARLANRCLESSDDYRSTIVSTLGKRQTDEFQTLPQIAREGVTVLVLVNDAIERIASHSLWSK